MYGVFFIFLEGKVWDLIFEFWYWIVFFYLLKFVNFVYYLNISR